MKLQFGTERTAAVIVGLLVLTTSASCEEPPGDHADRPVVAWVGDEAILLDELAEYLDRNLLGAEGEVESSESLDDVKSRLLDALIDERILAREAERQGIEVTDVEVAAYVAYGKAEESETAPPGETRTRVGEEQVRRRMLVGKLQEQIVRRLTPPSDEEVAAYGEKNREHLLPGRAIELRALQLRSPELAARVYAEIRSKRLTFQEAILIHEPTPGQTMPFRGTWSGLSAAVRTAIQDLDAGEVSPPLELDGRVYLFEVVAWIEEPHDLGAELVRRAREELESARRQQALDDHLAQLRAATRVRIKRGRLPFPYVPPADR